MKIYTNPQFHADHSIGMWFDFEGIPYEFDSAGVRINTDIDSQLTLAIFHTHENQITGIEQIANSTCPVVTTVWLDNYSNPNVVFNDFLWNRTKAYYTKYQFGPQTRLWYHAGPEYYIVPNQAISVKSKIFIAPNNTHANSRTYRSRIVDYLTNNYADLGFLTPLITETCELFSGPGYRPPHSDYYLNSCISIYGETIESGPGTCVTEKTWDALIRGHFILPFSNTGFISYLRTQGIQFPNWIDYSYDSIQDNDLRYEAYQAEINRLLKWSIDIWRTRYHDNFGIIRHNQDLLYTRPYHKTGIFSSLDQ